MINKKFQIFISSTYLDLRDERQSAVEAILKAGHIPAGMELFAAGDESQMETIKRWIDASDIYMLILGGRYGSIDPRLGLSYMELEYDYSLSIDKPVFAVVIKEESLNEKVKVIGKDAIETDHSKEYKAFRQKVLSKTSTFFSDCKDIKLAIHESLPDIQTRHELAGWVSAAEIQDTKSLMLEINRLLEENAKLTEENKSLNKRLSSPADVSNTSDEFNELISVLEKDKISSKYLTIRKGDEEQKTKTETLTETLLDIFYASRTLLGAGITNAQNVSNFERFLYINICPKLQIHGLVINENIPKVLYRRYCLTKKGLDFLAYLNKQALLSKPSKAKFAAPLFEYGRSVE